MLLTYDAVDAKGKAQRDTLEAADERDAVNQLRRRGLYVTRIERPRADAAPIVRNTNATVHFPLGTLVLFTRQMAMLLRAGSALVPAIIAIRRQMKKPAHVALLSRIVNDLESGDTLTDALRRHGETFDPVYCAIVAAGESSASLPAMFERLAGIVARRRSMRNKIIGALAYPTLLVCMSAKILGVMILFVLPRFNGMFTQLGVKPPAITRALLHTGDFARNHWLWLAAGAVAAVGAIVWTLLSQRGRAWLANFQLSIPIIGRLRSRLIQAQAFRTMGMLLESKVGVIDALELARQATRNRRFQKLFDAIEDAVTAGGSLSAALDSSRLIDPSLCQAVRTGEESGRMGEAMTYSADVLDETTAELMNAVMKLMEPAILMVMGVLVGGIAIALFMPLFDLTAAMK